MATNSPELWLMACSSLLFIVWLVIVSMSDSPTWLQKFFQRRVVWAIFSPLVLLGSRVHKYCGSLHCTLGEHKSLGKIHLWCWPFWTRPNEPSDTEPLSWRQRFSSPPWEHANQQEPIGVRSSAVAQAWGQPHTCSDRQRWFGITCDLLHGQLNV